MVILEMIEHTFENSAEIKGRSENNLCVGAMKRPHQTHGQAQRASILQAAPTSMKGCWTEIPGQSVKLIGSGAT